MGRVVADGDFAEFAGFQSIGIVGLGLIGGSLALAIRERWPRTVIFGVDRPEVIADAVARGVIAAGAPHAGALALRPLHLIVLAAPVLQNVACLQEIAAAAAASRTITSPVLVTDVGSTKLSIAIAARDLARSHTHLPVTFVAGHPIAGAAHGGLAHARADLFRGRPWLFTPPDDPTDEETRAAGLMWAFVRALGARPALLQADEHDRIMAYVSHLPQLAASSLMRVAGDGAGEPGLELSGAGLADTTRLASSPASMWTEILQSNAGHVRLALDAFIADLQHVRDQLTSPEAASWLEAGARWRARLGNGARID
jgi:prephenate dehydrogenase